MRGVVIGERRARRAADPCPINGDDYELVGHEIRDASRRIGSAEQRLRSCWGCVMMRARSRQIR
jgi:hypothetical protein